MNKTTAMITLAFSLFYSSFSNAEALPFSVTPTFEQLQGMIANSKIGDCEVQIQKVAGTGDDEKIEMIFQKKAIDSFNTDRQEIMKGTPQTASVIFSAKESVLVNTYAMQYMSGTVQMLGTILVFDFTSRKFYQAKVNYHRKGDLDSFSCEQFVRP